ncbi:hypothetical protein FRB91_008757 [Serendipita sp. 411]|nr:hypothetical protein FRB91_008757 [Serendipita sp. 411]KAG9029642.1 hypothetical protein FS842_004546 [Serendipita sp. 407]
MPERESSNFAWKKIKPGMCKSCGQEPYNTRLESLFCSGDCFRDAVDNAPGLIEYPEDHPIYKRVSALFTTSWLHPSVSPKKVKAIYMIVLTSDLHSSYMDYLNEVEYREDFESQGLPKGNESERWHGTTRECLIGDHSNTQFCQSLDCSLCGILQDSYSLDFYQGKTGWGRFGRGIYTTGTSSKADTYSVNNNSSKWKAVILNKVAIGNGASVTLNLPKLTAPPPGYDSVLGEPMKTGHLNYDECVVYNNDALRPEYLIMYK